MEHFRDFKLLLLVFQPAALLFISVNSEKAEIPLRDTTCPPKATNQFTDKAYQYDEHNGAFCI